MLNQETRTVTMSRSDMCRIATALTAVMFGFDKGTGSREMWERIRSEFIAQLDAQDPEEFRRK